MTVLQRWALREAAEKAKSSRHDLKTGMASSLSIGVPLMESAMEKMTEVAHIIALVLEDKQQ